MNKCLDLYGCVKTTKFHGMLLQPTSHGSGSSLSDILARAARPQARVHLHQGTAQCAEADAVGELFVIGDDLGIVSVHYVSQVGRGSRDTEQESTEAALSIQTRVRSKITAVRWNPGNQDEIAVLHQVPKSIYFYDINRTQGLPSRTLQIPVQVKGGGDVRYFGTVGHKYGLALGTASGAVILWDKRVSGGPICTLRSMSNGGITSLEVLDDERVVLGGNTSGEIKAWDIRMTSGSSLCFSAVPNQHPILSSMNISSELAKVDGLLSQAGYIPPCAVQCLKVNPDAQQRIAFHVASGWTGVYDFSRSELTHLHAPPTVLSTISNAPIPSSSSQYGAADNGIQPADDYSSVVTWWDDTEGGGSVSYEGGRWLRRRTGCWIPGSKFVVPSRTKDSVFVIDFRDVYHTGTRICKFSSDEAHAKAFSEISLSHEATCVLSTPQSNSIIVLGSQGLCSLVDQTTDSKNEELELV